MEQDLLTITFDGGVETVEDLHLLFKSALLYLNADQSVRLEINLPASEHNKFAKEA